MAEHFRLEDRFGDAAHVDLDQWPVGACRVGMQQARDDALAGAVLAQDEHVGIGGRDAAQLLQHRLHRRRLGNELALLVALEDLVLAAQARVLPPAVGQCQLVAQHAEQAAVVPGLLDEVAGTGLHGLHHQLDAAPGGHGHDGQLGVQRAQLRDQVDALLPGGGVARVVEVDQRKRRSVLLHGRQCFGRTARADGGPAFRLQQQAQGIEDVALVVGDENGGIRAHGRHSSRADRTSMLNPPRKSSRPAGARCAAPSRHSPASG
jgi:hypothetical protein